MKFAFFLCVSFSVSLPAIQGAPSACEVAWGNFKDEAKCYGDESNVESHVCTNDCQKLADAVLSSCKPGDVYDPEFYKTAGAELGGYKTYQLFGEYDGQTACDIGYSKNKCDLALAAYEKQSAMSLRFKLHKDSTGACAPDQNVGACSTTCAALVDAVAQNCVGKTFVPTDSFLAQTFEQVAWNPDNSLIKAAYLDKDEYAPSCTAKLGGSSAASAPSPSASASDSMMLAPSMVIQAALLLLLQLQFVQTLELA